MWWMYLGIGVYPTLAWRKPNLRFLCSHSSIMDDETAEIELVRFIIVMDHISQTCSPTASAEFE